MLRRGFLNNPLPPPAQRRKFSKDEKGKAISDPSAAQKSALNEPCVAQSLESFLLDSGFNPPFVEEPAWLKVALDEPWVDFEDFQVLVAKFEEGSSSRTPSEVDGHEEKFSTSMDFVRPNSVEDSLPIHEEQLQRPHETPQKLSNKGDSPPRISRPKKVLLRRDHLLLNRSLFGGNSLDDGKFQFYHSRSCSWVTIRTSANFTSPCELTSMLKENRREKTRKKKKKKRKGKQRKKMKEKQRTSLMESVGFRSSELVPEIEQPPSPPPCATSCDQSLQSPLSVHHVSSSPLHASSPKISSSQHTVVLAAAPPQMPNSLSTSSGLEMGHIKQGSKPSVKHYGLGPQLKRLSHSTHVGDHCLNGKRSQPCVKDLDFYGRLDFCDGLVPGASSAKRRCLSSLTPSCRLSAIYV